jgi:SM-20-related protein
MLSVAPSFAGLALTAQQSLSKTRASAFATSVPDSAFTALERDGYAVIPDWLQSDDAASVLADALALEAADQMHSAGLGGAAGSEASGWATDRDIRRSRTVWIQQPLGMSSAAESGLSKLPATRLALVHTMEALRSQLEASEVGTEPLHGPATMMSYLFYPVDGFFRRHRDGPRTIWASPFREHREVSFLLCTPIWCLEPQRLAGEYGNSAAHALGPHLSGSDLDAGWRKEWGGALRVYTGRDPKTYVYRDDAEGEAAPHVDVLPEAGTLVLLRSPQIEHEVLPTRRPRHCVVGWFCAVVEQGRVQPARPLWEESI